MDYHNTGQDRRKRYGLPIACPQYKERASARLRQRNSHVAKVAGFCLSFADQEKAQMRSAKRQNREYPTRPAESCLGSPTLYPSGRVPDASCFAESKITNARKAHENCQEKAQRGSFHKARIGQESGDFVLDLSDVRLRCV